MNSTNYRTIQVDGINIFYREAGTLGAPKLLLLHGFPTSGHMFRDLIPKLEDRYHIIAPDMPGFGHSDDPKENTFVSLAESIAHFTELVGFDRFAMYVFDFGAPTGFRMALNHPDRISAIISQNGNAYEDGLGDGWNPVRAYWADPSAANRDKLKVLLSDDTTYWQYTHGVPEPERVSPDGYTLDMYFLARDGRADIQLNLFADYITNIELYPSFQAYFREYQPACLVIWGAHDPFFLPPGAKAFKRDLSEAEVQLLDTGHFALETHAGDIADAIYNLLD